MNSFGYIHILIIWFLDNQIVLDRGVGNGVIDLLVESENKASKLGIQNNVEIEVLRRGK